LTQPGTGKDSGKARSTGAGQVPVADDWIIHCARHGIADKVYELVAAGVDVNARDANGMTALHHAAAIGSRPCVRVLVNSGRCDYLIRDGLGRYASELAIEWGRDYAVARLLAKHQVRQAHTRGVPAYAKP
jgi:ankyrin repeat protein